MFGTDEQKERWLRPLLEGEIRSCFAMTEPDVASSDATNIALRIERDGDDYVLNGRKWWISGAAGRRCGGRHRDGQDRPGRRRPHRQQSMILVPMDTAGRHQPPQPAGVRLPGQRGPLRAAVRGRPGPGGLSLLGEEGGGLRHGPGPARPRADPPLHAASVWPSGRWS